MKEFYGIMIICVFISTHTPSGLFGKNTPSKTVSKAAAASQTVEPDDTEIPFSFKSVVGAWSLKYSGNYGYYFRFYANYRAQVVLFLNMETITFNGVYTIEEGNKLKINIYEMKDEHRGAPGKGFVKAKSSYFIFGGYTVRKNRKETMYIKPLTIIIDGNNSEGYFEPLIKLAKI